MSSTGKSSLYQRLSTYFRSFKFYRWTYTKKPIFKFVTQFKKHLFNRNASSILDTYASEIIKGNDKRVSRKTGKRNCADLGKVTAQLIMNGPNPSFTWARDDQERILALLEKKTRNDSTDLSTFYKHLYDTLKPEVDKPVLTAPSPVSPASPRTRYTDHPLNSHHSHAAAATATGANASPKPVSGSSLADGRSASKGPSPLPDADERGGVATATSPIAPADERGSVGIATSRQPAANGGVSSVATATSPLPDADGCCCVATATSAPSSPVTLRRASADGGVGVATATSPQPSEDGDSSSDEDGGSDGEFTSSPRPGFVEDGGFRRTPSRRSFTSMGVGNQTDLDLIKAIQLKCAELITFVESTYVLNPEASDSPCLLPLVIGFLSPLKDAEAPLALARSEGFVDGEGDLPDLLAALDVEVFEKSTYLEAQIIAAIKQKAREFLDDVPELTEQQRSFFELLVATEDVMAVVRNDAYFKKWKPEMNLATISSFDVLKCLFSTTFCTDTGLSASTPQSTLRPRTATGTPKRLGASSTISVHQTTPLHIAASANAEMSIDEIKEKVSTILTETGELISTKSLLKQPVRSNGEKSFNNLYFHIQVLFGRKLSKQGTQKISEWTSFVDVKEFAHNFIHPENGYAHLGLDDCTIEQFRELNFTKPQLILLFLERFRDGLKTSQSKRKSPTWGSGGRDRFSTSPRHSMISPELLLVPVGNTKGMISEHTLGLIRKIGVKEESLNQLTVQMSLLRKALEVTPLNADDDECRQYANYLKQLGALESAHDGYLRSLSVVSKRVAELVSFEEIDELFVNIDDLSRRFQSLNQAFESYKASFYSPDRGSSGKAATLAKEGSGDGQPFNPRVLELQQQLQNSQKELQASARKVTQAERELGAADLVVSELALKNQATQDRFRRTQAKLEFAQDEVQDAKAEVLETKQNVFKDAFNSLVKGESIDLKPLDALCDFMNREEMSSTLVQSYTDCDVLSLGPFDYDSPLPDFLQKTYLDAMTPYLERICFPSEFPNEGFFQLEVPSIGQISRDEDIDKLLDSDLFNQHLRDAINCVFTSSKRSYLRSDRLNFLKEFFINKGCFPQYLTAQFLSLDTVPKKSFYDSIESQGDDGQVAALQDALKENEEGTLLDFFTVLTFPESVVSESPETARSLDGRRSVSHTSLSGRESQTSDYILEFFEKIADSPRRRSRPQSMIEVSSQSPVNKADRKRRSLPADSFVFTGDHVSHRTPESGRASAGKKRGSASAEKRSPLKKTPSPIKTRSFEDNKSTFFGVLMNLKGQVERMSSNHAYFKVSSLSEKDKKEKLTQLKTLLKDLNEPEVFWNCTDDSNIISDAEQFNEVMSLFHHHASGVKPSFNEADFVVTKGQSKDTAESAIVKIEKLYQSLLDSSSSPSPAH